MIALLLCETASYMTFKIYGRGQHAQLLPDYVIVCTLERTPSPGESSPGPGRM